MLPRKVLIAIDGSETSLRALDFYASSLHRDSDLLLFPFVMEPPSLPRGTGASFLAETEAYANLIREATEKGRRLGQRVRARCDQLGLRNTAKFVETLSSQAGPAIVETALVEGADLILVGSRGLGTLRRTIMGSVSDYVLHHAHLPVIVLPAPHAAASSSQQQH